MTEKELDIAERFYDELKDDIYYHINFDKTKTNIYLLMNGDICSLVLAAIVNDIVKENPERNYKIISVIPHDYISSSSIVLNIEDRSMRIIKAFCTDNYAYDTSDMYKTMLSDIDKNIDFDYKKYIKYQIDQIYINTIVTVNNGILIDPTCLTDICIKGKPIGTYMPFSKIWIHTIESISEMLRDTYNDFTDLQIDVVEYIHNTKSPIYNSKIIDDILYKYLYIDGIDDIDEFLKYRPDISQLSYIEYILSILESAKNNKRYISNLYYLYTNR